jgi:Family of unknown function (DUF6184)
MPKLKFILPPLVLIAAAASCSSKQEKVMVPSSAVNPRTTAQEASDSIAEARCNREAACSAIGPGKAFASQDQCMQAMTADAAQELGGTECKDGVADRYLKACVSQATQGECRASTTAPDKLSSYDSCHTDKMCLGG